MALTPGKERFALLVATGTGLSRNTVRAWVQAEGGPDDNPLNIRQRDGSFRGYGSVDAAVQATLRLLNSNPSYQPILRVARAPQATPPDELQAIIESPWAAGHYTTRGSRTRGGILLGAYSFITGNPRSRSTAVPASSGPPTASSTTGGLVTTGTPVFNPFDPFELAPDWWPGGPPNVDVDPAGWFAGIAQWIGEKAALGFLYAVLTLAAAAVIVLGLMRATGTSRTQILAARAPGGQTDDIPF